MSKGKHAALAERRNFDKLENRVNELSAELATSKKLLKEAREEVTRLRAIEAVFDGTKDYIVEVDRLKRELDDIQGKNFVLEVRLQRWAKIIMSPGNSEFVRMNRDMFADIVELGYWQDDASDNRNVRRATKTAGSMKKKMNLALAVKAVS